MLHTFHSVVLLVLLLTGISGCGSPRPTSPDAPPQLSSSEREQLLSAFAKAELESQNVAPPQPIITLPALSGWSKSESRPLPAADHGFTVAYDHDESGLAVTLYQFTRGLTVIPNDVNSSIVKEEMKGAKNGINQVVQLGVWQAAEETKSETVQLGDSQQQALWSQYKLTVNDEVLASDIYLWAQANTFFKIRCTAASEDAETNQAIIKPLLTALGSSTNLKE